MLPLLGKQKAKCLRLVNEHASNVGIDSFWWKHSSLCGPWELRALGVGYFLPQGSRRPRLRQEPGLFETIANPAIPPFAICQWCSEHLLCDVKLKSCKQRQPSESNRTTMINKLMEHAFKFVYENKTITSYLKNYANQLINRLWGTPRLEPGTSWSAANRSYHWIMYPCDETWIHIVDCMLLMSPIRKWASQLNLQMGCSGNWTRDLSHPKRESCH